LADSLRSAEEKLAGMLAIGSGHSSQRVVGGRLHLFCKWEQCLARWCERDVSATAIKEGDA
jgi:hypothetical protein